MRRAAAALALLAAAACSSGAGDSTPPPSTSTAPNAAETTSPTSAPGSTTNEDTAAEPTTARPPTSTTVPNESTSTAPVDPALEIVRRLEVAERGIRDETLTAEQRAQHGRDQQAAYRAVGSDRDLIDRLPSLVADDVRTAVAFNLAARAAVLDHAATRPPVDPPTTVPAWSIVEPRPIDELLGYYREAEALTGVEWEYLAAINLVETRMGRIVGASSAGAIGPMQFLPETWERCCTGDPNDPRDAIIGAATYLTQEGAPGDMQAALYAYNPNNGYVGSVIAYAANLRADERAYVGYHAWEVYVSTSEGTIRLPVGYSEPEPVDAAAWLAANPPT